MITKAQARALAIIDGTTVNQFPHFARLMWPDSPVWGRTAGRRLGLYQRAGSFLGALRGAGLVTGMVPQVMIGTVGSYLHTSYVPARLTDRGREALAAYKEAHGDPLPPARAPETL